MATDIRPLWLKLREANRAALAALGLLKSQESSHSTQGNAMTTTSTAAAPLEESPGIYARRRAQLRLLITERAAGNIAAFAEQFGYSRSRVSQFLSDTYNDGRSIGERAARALEEVASLPIGWLDAGAPAGATSTDHAAQLRAAIADARAVYESVPVADQVLDYLEQILAAGVPIPAQTGMPGGADASIEKETHAGAGAEPVVGADPFRNAAREAVMRQARADLAQAADAPVAGSEWPAWARDIDKVAADMKRIELATGELFGQLANVLAAAGTQTFDQAAAAMAAESAQLLADAERSTAKKAVAVGLDPLSILSREVNSLSDKLQLPADLTVQLLVLAELRGIRAEQAGHRTASAMVLS